MFTAMSSLKLKVRGILHLFPKVWIAWPAIAVVGVGVLVHIFDPAASLIKQSGRARYESEEPHSGDDGGSTEG